MDLCLIWAQDRAGAVSRGDAIPWNVPDERQYFTDTTQDSPVIVGLRTWHALGARPLPGRQNIVLMRGHDAVELGGAVRSCSIGDAIMLAGTSRPAKVFIVGGVDLHVRALPVAQRVYVTERDLKVEGADAYAPALPRTQWTRHFETELRASQAGVRYRFVEYRRAGRH